MRKLYFGQHTLGAFTVRFATFQCGFSGTSDEVRRFVARFPFIGAFLQHLLLKHIPTAIKPGKSDGICAHLDEERMLVCNKKMALWRKN